MPQNAARDFGVDETLPAYTRPEATPAYRLKDAFLWNLHEALTTPDQFAKTLVDELDLPPERKFIFILDIAKQIREQLEQYAGIALHPLFQPTTGTGALNGNGAPSMGTSQVQTPLPAASTPQPNGVTNGDHSTPRGLDDAVTASASQPALPEVADIHNPDDTYRCVVSLSINLVNRLYTDRFEWSLIHPPGLAEEFAKQTCADLGLAPEWASAIAHAIYEAVLRLKKEVCENGGLLGVSGYGGEIDNDAANGEAGWRYCDEAVSGVSGDRWEPRVEVLSKEEIEKREGDRERQLRRVRRETARYSSTANVSIGTPGGDPYASFNFGAGFTPGGADGEEQRMGRGERSKKKRRFRSLSPLGRDTPGAQDVAGYGGGAALSDAERQSWRCRWCWVWGSAVWAVRDGPMGSKVRLLRVSRSEIAQILTSGCSSLYAITVATCTSVTRSCRRGTKTCSKMRLGPAWSCQRCSGRDSRLCACFDGHFTSVLFSKSRMHSAVFQGEQMTARIAEGQRRNFWTRHGNIHEALEEQQAGLSLHYHRSLVKRIVTLPD